MAKRTEGVGTYRDDEEKTTSQALANHTKEEKGFREIYRELFLPWTAHMAMVHYCPA